MKHSCVIAGLGFLLNFNEFKKILFNICPEQIDVDYEKFDRNYFQYNFPLDRYEICFLIINKYVNIDDIELVYRLPVDDEFFFILHKLYYFNSESNISKIKKIIPEEMKNIKEIENKKIVNFAKENDLENKNIDWYIMNYNT